ncbi:hypothetical protein K488DRAFT_82164 [Vararia minispora EC-137]|uniref:Uncharacterized protein n=1 Tax=Vararia minispora EC-137 TaxID=1314806 RepID=A0ACB8QWZ0_9AGAM|nr:hypothetical protein K488DRAFT_82164 [Vararia minispora EC-137]
MFGESESESPRVSSPWDHILASSLATEKVYYSQDAATMPRLSAEIEEGNVEYKLHLIQPSPARFARLVTQLKWRLLEGGGQAFYELGVADSGALVGLTPDDLADTLTTMHAMAAEIDARVVITKKIEVVGMGVRREDAREFAKKRRDRDHEKDRAVSRARAKAKWRNTPDSYTSGAETASSFDPSSFNSLLAEDAEDEYDFGASTPALSVSVSTSPSPPTLAVPTPNDVPEMPVSSQHDDSLALFTMDDELSFFTRNDDAEPVSVKPTASSRVIEQFAPTTATVTVPAGALPIPLPSFQRLTKSEKRRITRDLRRAERKRVAEQQQPIGEITVPVLPPPPAVVEDTDKALLVEQLADDMAVLDIESSKPAAPRTIVEALIIRELELEEAFLDFARF